MKPKLSGPLYILLAAIFWSFGGLLGKLIPFSGISIAAIRGVIAALVIGLYRKSFRLNVTKSTLLAAVCLTLTTVLFMMSNKLTSAANAIVLQYTSPVFIILLSLIVYKQKPSKRDIFALLGVGVGIGLFFYEQLKGGAPLGDGLALLSGLTFAGVFFANKLPGANPMDATYLGNLLSVFLLPFLLFDPAIRTMDPLPWLMILVMGVFQLGIGYILFALGIRQTSATTSSILATLEPVLNPIWVFLVLGETPSPLALTGGAIVLLTVVIYNTIVTRDNFRKKSA